MTEECCTRLKFPAGNLEKQLATLPHGLKLGRKVVILMYYVTVVDRKAKESGKAYKTIRVTDHKGSSREFFTAYGEEAEKLVPTELRSTFPETMVPVYVQFEFAQGQDNRADLRVVRVSEIEE